MWPCDGDDVTVSAEKAQACSPPRSLGELFWGFSMLSLQGFGGVMAVTQRELIERRRWMPLEPFLEDWAVAQVLPGPNVANLGVILGDRWFGARGAAVCLLGLFLFPLIIVGLLALVVTRWQDVPWVQGALHGMGLMVVAIRVSVTDSGVTGRSTGWGRSVRRKTMPVSGAAGRKVSSTR